MTRTIHANLTDSELLLLVNNLNSSDPVVIELAQRLQQRMYLPDPRPNLKEKQ